MGGWGWAAVTLLLVTGTAGVPAAVAGWVNGGLSTARFEAAPDWVAPLVGSSVIAKTTGYLTGSIKQGGAYYVYASVSDTGSPPSGVASVTSDVRAITPTGTAVTLVAGSYSAGGATYTHRSAALTASTPLANGARAYSMASVDVAGNSRSQTGYSATVDNTAPSASDIQTTNVTGGVNGRAEAGDTVRFTYSEQVDPASILTGWSGSSTNVVLRLIDGGCTLSLLVTVCEDDRVEVYDAANADQLPLGTVDLNQSDYHGGGLLGTQAPLTFGASGTPSTMVQSGATITVTLGTASGAADTATSSGSMVWSPSTAAYDGAGNAALSSVVSELGTSDKEF